MSAPIAPISPLPAYSFGIALNAATPTEISPGLYSNTHTIRLFNPGPTGEDVWLKFQNVVSTPAFATITVPGSSSQAVPVVGDTITLDGNVLTAVGGPRVAGTDSFSVDIRATATLTVNLADSFNVGDTIVLATKKGPPDSTTVLTAIAGVRAPGSLTFQVINGANAQATEIAAAMNDSAFDGSPAGSIVAAAAVGAVITVTAGFSRNKRGAQGNASALRVNTSFGLGLTTTCSIVGGATIVNFAGGVDADGGRMLQDGAIVSNDARDYANNIIAAINDQTNAVAADFSALSVSSGSTLRVIAKAVGVLGNGLVLASSSVRITVTTPTAGGADAIPAALTAATSMIIPGGATYDLVLGPEGDRNTIAPAAWWTTNPGANIGMLAQMSGGAGVTLNVTYINGPGKS